MERQTKPAVAELSQEVATEASHVLEDDHPQDECGVYGAYAPGEPLLATAYSALRKLRHRGQSGAGFAFLDTATGNLDCYVGTGKVGEAIPDAKPKAKRYSIYEQHESPVIVGHTRYSTADNNRAAQPFLGERTDFALSHNGHIEDIFEVATSFGVDTRDAASDSHGLTMLLDARAAAHGSLNKALHEVLPVIEGAYCLTITDGQRLIGVRDPWGFRPLVLGKLPGAQNGYILASEESAFKATGAEFVRDIQQGEIVNIDNNGVSSTFIDRYEGSSECVMEYVYLVRPWEVVNGVHVSQARKNMGRYLANNDSVKADMVVAVPNSGKSAAEGYTRASGLPQVEGIYAEEGEDRTFLLRKGARDVVLDNKLIIDRYAMQDKRIVLVDDSVIKGNTMSKLIKRLREEGGVAEVHVRSAAHRYQHACYQGMDTRDTDLLVARGRTDEEICKIIGADSIAFNDISEVHAAINESRNGEAVTMCGSCATGEYPFSKGTFAKDMGSAALLPMIDSETVTAGLGK